MIALLATTSWAWGLLIAAAIAGTLRDVAFVAFVGILLSAVLGLQFAAVLLVREQRRSPALSDLPFTATLFTVLAVLSLYLSYVVAPVIDQTAPLRDLLQSWRSPYRVHPWLIAALLMVALGLWVIVVLRFRRLAKAVDRILDII